jgi:hypothetical protein
MDFYWNEKDLKISVSTCAVEHAVNVDGYRPLGRKLTKSEIEYVHSKVCNSRLLRAYKIGEDAFEDYDIKAFTAARNEFHAMTHEIVFNMNIN